MSEKSLEVLRLAFEAGALENFELFETRDAFIRIRIKTEASLHEFCLPETENILRLVLAYMEARELLEGDAIKLEALWNSLAYEFRLITRFMDSHEKGLQIYADFQYSPLLSEDLWQEALRACGLYVALDLAAGSPGARHLVLARDPILGS